MVLGKLRATRSSAARLAAIPPNVPEAERIDKRADHLMVGAWTVDRISAAEEATHPGQS